MQRHHGIEVMSRREFEDDDVSHLARCSCGWLGDLCATAVLAQAAGEQHLTLEAASRPSPMTR